MMQKNLLEHLSYGMYVVGVADGGRHVGCVVNTVVQVTAKAPIIAVSVSKNNYTCTAMRRAGSFTLSVLSEQTRSAVIARMGFSSSRDKDKFAGLKIGVTDEGIAYLDEQCVGYLVCDLLSMIDCETHVLFTARVREENLQSEIKPMTYLYYHEVLRGRAPANAPTHYEAEKPAGLAEPISAQKPPEQWVCDVCGYVYEGDLAREPDSFRCPVCGADKSHFKKR